VGPNYPVTWESEETILRSGGLSYLVMAAAATRKGDGFMHDLDNKPKALCRLPTGDAKPDLLLEFPAQFVSSGPRCLST
jgi:hypothetical protein